MSRLSLFYKAKALSNKTNSPLSIRFPHGTSNQWSAEVTRLRKLARRQQTTSAVRKPAKELRPMFSSLFKELKESFDRHGKLTIVYDWYKSDSIRFQNIIDRKATPRQNEWIDNFPYEQVDVFDDKHDTQYHIGIRRNLTKTFEMKFQSNEGANKSTAYAAWKEWTFTPSKTDNIYVAKSYKWRTWKVSKLDKTAPSKKMKKQLMRASIYTMPNTKASQYQASQYCMIDYILEYAEKRKGTYKKLNRLDIMKIVDRDDPENGLDGFEVETICNKLKLHCTATMINHEPQIYVRQKSKAPHLMFIMANGHCYPVADKLRLSFERQTNIKTKWMIAEKKEETKYIVYKGKLENIINKAFSPSIERYAVKKATGKVKSLIKHVFPGRVDVDKKKKKNTSCIVRVIEMPEFNQDEILGIMKKMKCLFTLRTKAGSLTNIKIGKTSLLACPDIEESKIAAKWAGIKWKGQTLSKIANDYFKMNFKLHGSEYNPVLRSIIHNWSNSPVLFQKERPLKTDKAYDIIKCYTEQLIKEQNFPIFTVNDYPEPFRRRIKVGIYYIETENCFPLVKTGWYSHETARWAKKNIPDEIQIKYQVVSQYRQNSEMFKYFYRSVEGLPKNVGKLVFNSFIGNLNCCSENLERNYVTSSKRDAMVFYQKPNANFSFDGELYHIRTTEETKNNQSHKPIYHQVIENGRIAVYEAWKKSKGKLIAVKTDCVVIRDGELPIGNKPGEYRLEKIPDTIQSYSNYEEKRKPFYYKHKEWQWNETEHDESEFVVPDMACCIDGSAGVGKSFAAKKVDAPRLSFTNTASNNIGGSTLHNYFKMSQSDDSIASTKAFAKVDKLLIDEYSMIPENMLAILTKIKLNNPKIKIILVGDSRQIQFMPKTIDKVDEFNIEENKPSPRLLDSYGFAYLCDFEKITLNYFHRADKTFCENLRNRDFRSHCGNHSTSDINICVTNEYRDMINATRALSNDNITIATWKDRLYAKWVGVKPVPGGVWLTLDQFEVWKKLYPPKKVIKYDHPVKLNTPWCGKLSVKKMKLLKNQFYTLSGHIKENKEKKTEAMAIFTCGIDGIQQIGENTIIIPVSKIEQYFAQAFAMTVNKLQGATITKPYSIHEWRHKHNDRYKKYTSCSRAKYSGQYNIV